MLGKLARWLRILGYDTLYISASNNEILKTAQNENRIILTRNAAFFKNITDAEKFFVRTDNYKDQLREIKEKLRLSFPAADFLGRCPECNGEIAEIKKTEAEGLVASFVIETENRFSRCAGCGKIYWEGSHTEKIKKLIEELSKGK